MPAVAAFAKKNPDVNFEVHDGSTYTLYDYLLEGIIEISVARTPLRLDEVEAAALRTEPMIAVSAPGAQAEAAEPLRLADLPGRPLILYRRYEQLILDAFRAQKLEPDVFCTCDDARGAGLHVRTLHEPSLQTKIVLIWKKDRKLSPAAQDFLDICLHG